MEQACRDFPFQHQLSLKPLIDFWREKAAPSCLGRARTLDLIEGRLREAPELLAPIADRSILASHGEVVRALMGAIFAPAFWETQAIAVMAPFTMEVLFATPLFEKLMGREELLVQRVNHPPLHRDIRPLRAYRMLLSKLYGMGDNASTSAVRVSRDPETGLTRYHRILPDLQFLNIEPVAELPELNPEQRRYVQENVGLPEKLKQVLPPEKFRFTGLVVCVAADVTESEVLSDLQRELIDQSALFSVEGFAAVQRHLATFFQLPDLILGLAAFRDEKVILLNNSCDQMDLFGDTRTKAMADFLGSIFEDAVENRELRYISDLAARDDLGPVERVIAKDGVRSLVVLPLVYGDEVIGEMDLASKRPGAFNNLDNTQMSLLAPLFAMAVKKSLNEIDNQVQRIIKEKCTAVHGSVEWRFREEARRHLDRVRSGVGSEMGPIVFKDVYPLFASSDIRGSSELRNQAVAEDLAEHLRLASEVVRWAGEARDWPILGELSHRLRQQMEQVQNQSSTADETMVNQFISREVEPVFDHVAGLSPRVKNAIDKYAAAVDQERGTVHRQRKAFEESVSRLNERLGAYLDQEEAHAQAMFPHYFEKHQTDGLDYMIYLGASMADNSRFDEFFVRNLRLWQIQVAAGVAAITEQLKKELPVPLDTAHLIFVQHSPLSIRFRYDEKRFDVDGAYDVRHEIIKSRLDKSVVAGKGERLTQPGMVSLVYTNPLEAREIRRYLNYLSANGTVSGPVETLELADMPGVRGLKAMRAALDLNSRATTSRLAAMAG